MLHRRGLVGPCVVLALSIACLPVARAQPAEQAPPPVVQNVAPVPPPPVVQNVPPPPVVQNVAPPPLVQNVPPPPVVQPVAPEPPPDLDRNDGSGKLFLSGLGTFVLAYGLTVLAGAIATATDDPAGPDLYIPVFGPLIFWDGTNRPVDAASGAYLILSALMQTVGIVGIIGGIAEIAGGSDTPN